MKENDFDKLGFYMLAVLYLTFALVSFISAPIVTKLGDKLSLAIGAFCYVAYLGAFILPLKRSELKDNETLQNMYNFIIVL